MTKVELFEIIRKDYHHHQKSIRSIAQNRGVHRRTVRQALKSAIPPKRKSCGRKCNVLTQRYQLLIERWLTDDCKAPRKQRHTAQRIFDRLQAEHRFQGSLSSIAHYVTKIRKELGQLKQAFIPQHHVAGDEAEVDWYEAMVDFGSSRQKVYLFQMRACHSGREFHRAFMHQNQQAFLEAHVAAFAHFGGVFKRIRYDNLTSAVKKILRGRQRIETTAFIALRSHYLFESVFCLPGIEGAHEKGGVEGGVGRFRRAHLVPVPQMEDLSALNRFLLSACERDDQRTVRGQIQTVMARWERETTSLQPLPNKAFETFIVTTPKVNSKSLASVNGNHYSVPVDYIGQTVEAQIHAETIEFFKQGKRIAHHLRCYQQHQIIAELDHYLSLLRRKPGAFPGSVALKQAKQQHKWPEIYEHYWQRLIEKEGVNRANVMLIDFLWWARDYDYTQVHQVLKQAMDCGSYPLDAIQLLMRQALKQEKGVNHLSLDSLEALKQFERPVGPVAHYDHLLQTSKGLSS